MSSSQKCLAFNQTSHGTTSFAPSQSFIPSPVSFAWDDCQFILWKWLPIASSTDLCTPTLRTGRMTLTLSLVISWRSTKRLCCHWASKRERRSTQNASAGSWALTSEPNRGETFQGRTCSMWDLWKCQCRPASLVLRDRFLLFPDLSQQPPRRVRCCFYCVDQWQTCLIYAKELFCFGYWLLACWIRPPSDLS